MKTVLEREEPLYLLHRRDLVDTKLLTWTHKDANDEVPLLHIFSNIVKERLVPLENGNIKILPFQKESPGPAAIFSATEAALLKLPGSHNPPIDKFGTERTKEQNDGRPYTCLEIPFPGAGKYLIALTTSISGSGTTFQDLVKEQPESGTRSYEIYGPEWVHNRIRYVDIPCARELYPAEFSEETEFFRQQVSSHNLHCVPMEYYSVVALDNRNSAPSKLRPVNIDENLLTNISAFIEYEKILTHPYFREDPPDILYWFLSYREPKRFVLQLIGPMWSEVHTSQQLSRLSSYVNP